MSLTLELNKQISSTELNKVVYNLSGQRQGEMLLALIRKPNVKLLTSTLG